MLINMTKTIYLPPRRFEACCPFLGGKPQISVTINIQFLSYTILLYSILNFVVQSIYYYHHNFLCILCRITTVLFSASN